MELLMINGTIRVIFYVYIYVDVKTNEKRYVTKTAKTWFTLTILT